LARPGVHGTFSQPRPSHPAASGRLARTLGVVLHHFLMRRVVITGGPGAGKTTLLTALAARGYETVAESAREVIAARLTQGLAPRPEPAVFAREILAKDVAKYERSNGGERLVFFDRSAVEALAMVHEVSPLPEVELKEKLTRYSFYQTVFVLPPWQEIYVNDAERDHSFSHAVAVFQQLLRWYKKCGYVINEVPCFSVAQRVSHVLQAIANDA
jgi:predicted ATPase